MNSSTSNSELPHVVARTRGKRPPGYPYRTYVAVLFSGIVLAGLFAGWVHYTALFPLWIIGCDGSEYSDDRYLATCTAGPFIEYERGALFLGMEADAVMHLSKADVLFVGNSRTQFAFSTEAIETYFEARGASYYLAGFPHGENDLFPAALIRKWDLRPKVIVVNTDEFFTNYITPLAQKVVDDTWLTRVEYRLKRWSQGWHRKACAASGIVKRALCGHHDTVFRSRRNGSWSIGGDTQDGDAGEVTFSQDSPGADLMREQVNNARSFKMLADQKGICLVLTTVPASGSLSAMGAAIARKIGAPYIKTSATGLSRFDSSHLNRKSAERWTTDFLQQFDRAMDDCVQDRK
jgi:hypothetical protein